MGKGKRKRQSTKAKPASPPEEVDEAQEVIGEPPKKNFALLVGSSVAFAAWVIYLIVLALQS